MPDIRRILCPVDFSGASQLALDHAIALAGWYRSHVTALYVSHPANVLEPGILVTTLPGTSLPADAGREQLEPLLRRWLEPAGAKGVGCDTLFEEHHNVAACILDRAASLQADLIVLGTHGRGGFDRLLLGSVTEKVLRKAAVPVLTVPPPASGTSKLPFNQLLCPVDFSESSLAALRFALSIAKESGARLTLLHVFEWPEADDLLPEPGVDLAEYRNRIDAATVKRLDDLLSSDDRTWCQPVTKVSYGKPYREILTTATAEHADLIVIGVHGRNVLDLALFGSTTNQVVRRASSPVLTLKR
jgi:nucleotide-binding universal stress UspA family protein